jgi:NAD(P)-dependent dehydrogenase (short-subunit alcohol dehydrogenase family)
MELRGTVAVVTGAARRLGAATAVALARAGCHVVINYRTAEAEAEATATTARAAGVRAITVQADVSDSAQVARLLDTTLTEFGRVDTLVANAGAFRRTPLATLTEADWDDMLTNNLRVTFLCAQQFGLHMRAHAGGALILLADVAGLRRFLDKRIERPLFRHDLRPHGYVAGNLFRNCRWRFSATNINYDTANYLFVSFLLFMAQENTNCLKNNEPLHSTMRTLTFAMHG